MQLFQLHLSGPSKIWYDNLKVHNLHTLRDFFDAKYVSFKQRTSKFQAHAQFSFGRICRQQSPVWYDVKKNWHRHDACIHKWLTAAIDILYASRIATDLERALEAVNLRAGYGYRDAIPEAHTGAAARPATTQNWKNIWMT